MKLYHLLAKYRILHLLCCFGLLCQLQGVLREWIWPTHIVTNIYEEKLQKNPPVIFKICTSPGFNDTALNMEGYIDSFAYSIGSKMLNDSLYGWSGQNNDSVEGMMKNVIFINSLMMFRGLQQSPAISKHRYTVAGVGF